MIFIYEPDPHSLEIHRMCKYELQTTKLVQVIVWQIYICTDIRCLWNYINHVTLRVVNNYKQLLPVLQLVTGVQFLPSHARCSRSLSMCMTEHNCSDRTVLIIFHLILTDQVLFVGGDMDMSSKNNKNMLK